MAEVAQTYKEHGSAVLKLGLPLIASNLAQYAIHMTDAIMLGRYDLTALAAVTLAATVFFVIFIVGAGFAMAVTPLVAEAEAAGDVTQIRRLTRMGLWLSVIYGCIFTIPFFFAGPLLLMSGQSPEIAALAEDYLVIAGLGLVPALLVMTLKSYLAALEHTPIILWATVLAALVNPFVNYAFIFGNWGAPELGIQGAAIASVIVQLLSVIVLLIYALRILPEHELLKNLLRPDNEILARVFRLGWPIGLTALAEGGLFAASTFLMGLIGKIELAAHGIVIQLASLTFMVHMGLSQAATVRAGRAFGEADEMRLRRGAVTIIAMSLAFAVVTAAVFVLVPEPLIVIFLDPNEVAKADVIAISILLLAMAALFQVMDATQVMALGLLRGVQDTTVPMVMAAISYWIVGVPVSYVLAFTLGYGAVGLWLGLVVGLAVAAVLLMGRFWTKSVRI